MNIKLDPNYFGMCKLFTNKKLRSHDINIVEFYKAKVEKYSFKKGK